MLHVAAVLAVFAGVLIFSLLIQGDRPFYYDAAGYWGLADTFKNSSGHFSLLNFDSDLRGYALPLVLHFMKGLNTHVGANLSPGALVKVLNSAIATAIGMILIPEFAKLAFPRQRWPLLLRVGVTVLFVLIWGGHIAYPLTDVPALASALAALVLAGRAPRWWGGLGAGAFAALAVEMRPAYVLLLPIGALLVAFNSGGVRRAILPLVLLAAGFAVVALPQSLSSHKYHDTWSFVPGTAFDLGNKQLAGGTMLQRYDTIVSPRQAGALFYYYPAGNRLMEKRGGVVRGNGDYIKLVLSHPYLYGSLYVRHVVNGFDQRYWDPYAPARANGLDAIVQRVAGLALLFLALLRLAWPEARRRLGKIRWRWPVALAVTCATSLTAATETRFFLPIWVIAVSLVVGSSWPDPRRVPRPGRTMAVLAGAAALWILLVVLIATDTTNNLTYIPA